MLQNSENKPRGFYVMILGDLYLEGHIDGGAYFWNFAVVMEDFKQSKYSGSQCETFGKIYEINLVLTEIWEKESNRIVKLFMVGNEW